LAKAANRIAKKHKNRTAGVHFLADPALEAKALRWLDLEDVWGIGPASARKLHGYGLRKAADFIERPEAWVRRTFGVVLTRTWLELQGTSCSDLCEVEPQRQTIRTSRSFEKNLTEIVAVEEAISSFATRIASKLRERHLNASTLSVFLHSNPFDEKIEQFSGYRMGTLMVPSNATLEITNLALKLARLAIKPGHGIKKAGVEAWGLVPETIEQQNLFDTSDRDRIKRLQASMDTVSKRWGPEALGVATAGTDPGWKMRRDHMSRRYTTTWSEVLEVDLDRCYKRPPQFWS
jgi:DNA polymerase V